MVGIMLLLPIACNKFPQYVILKTPNIYYTKFSWVRNSEALIRMILVQGVAFGGSHLKT